MDRLGPWDGERRVAVAVSGGPDSLALALLAQRWGTPSAFIVDHGLRPESATEAEGARFALAARGIPARVLVLAGLAKGPGLAARARAARYGALTAACRKAGLVDLLLGHHAADQAETVLMRRRRGSGAAGLSGMAALVETDDVRLLRPLLSVTPEQLRAIVAEAGLVPAADPTNDDPASTRVQLRREIGTDRDALLAEASRAGQARSASERAAAGELAARASIYPEGYAVLSAGPIGGDALAGLLRSLSGRRYPVDPGALAAEPRACTLAGVQLRPAGRAGDGWLLTREPSAAEPPVPADPGAVWDARFRVEASPGGTTVGALGPDAGAVRKNSALPSLVLRSLPAFRYKGVLSAVPHLSYTSQAKVVDRYAVQSACLPAAGAPWVAS